MFCFGRWIHNMLAIALIALGIGILLASLLSWGWIMIVLAFASIICGVFMMCDS